MSGGPPAGRQISPDGRWWWDGKRWAPMPGTDPDPRPAQQLPAQVPTAYQPASPLYPTSMYVYGPRTNSSAVAALVFGIISWFLCPFVGGVLAIILGHIARGQIRRSGEGGGGMATAGLVLGYIHVVAIVLIVIFWVVLLGGLTAFIGHLPTPTPIP
jgi:hypothetical protein